MKNNKIIKFIIIAIVIIIILVGGYFFINDRNQISKINEEIDKINSTAEIDQEIKTTGKYGEVEKGVKEYLTEYRNTVEQLNNMYNTDEYKNILTTSNYEADKPDFNSSLELINNIREKQESTKNKITEMVKQENIEKRADELGLQGKYKTTFVDIIKVQDEANEIAEGIEEDKQIVNKIEEIINILKNNPTKWVIKGSQVQFYDQDLLNQYNSITTELNTLASSIDK